MELGVQAASKNRHYLFALLPGESKEFEAILEATLLPDFRYHSKTLFDFRRTEFDPELTVLGKFSAEDRAKASFANRNATTMDWVGPGRVGRNTYAHIYFSAQKLAHRSRRTLISDVV